MTVVSRKWKIITLIIDVEGMKKLLLKLPFIRAIRSGEDYELDS